MVHPSSTCCKTSGDGICACAAQAKCSCGKESALHCTCNKAATENATSGARCSCSMSPILKFVAIGGMMALTPPGSRPAGQCTCERAVTENHPVTGATCPCGKRGAGELRDLKNTHY